jgi:hypothetical protein
MGRGRGRRLACWLVKPPPHDRKILKRTIRAISDRAKDAHRVVEEAHAFGPGRSGEALADGASCTRGRAGVEAGTVSAPLPGDATGVCTGFRVLGGSLSTGHTRRPLRSGRTPSSRWAGARAPRGNPRRRISRSSLARGGPTSILPSGLPETRDHWGKSGSTASRAFHMKKGSAGFFLVREAGHLRAGWAAVIEQTPTGEMGGSGCIQDRTRPRDSRWRWRSGWPAASCH